MSAITITITDTRAIIVEGRLVAGETAAVSIVGAVPAGLYLVAPDQTVVAACESWTAGQGTPPSGTGVLQLATQQVAALFANTPAGRMIAVWALAHDSGGSVAGAGWIPVISAPMPDELVDIDIDFYLRASQVGAGLAIVDGKLVCTVTPTPPPVTSVNSKTGAVVLDAADVGALATSGSTATGPIIVTDSAPTPSTTTIGPDEIELSAQGDFKVFITDVGTTFSSPSASMSMTVSWPEVVDGASAIYATSLDIPYALAAVTLTNNAGTLADRAINGCNLIDATGAQTLTLPAGTVGAARDFLVRLTVAASQTVTFAAPTGEGINYETESGQWPDLSAAGTYLLRFTEIAQESVGDAVTAATFLVQCGECKAATQGGAA